MLPVVQRGKNLVNSTVCYQKGNRDRDAHISPDFVSGFLPGRKWSVRFNRISSLGARHAVPLLVAAALESAGYVYALQLARKPLDYHQ